MIFSLRARCERRHFAPPCFFAMNDAFFAAQPLLRSPPFIAADAFSLCVTRRCFDFDIFFLSPPLDAADALFDAAFVISCRDDF